MKKLALAVLFGIGVLCARPTMAADAQIPYSVETIPARQIRGWEEHFEMKAGETIEITVAGVKFTSGPVPAGKQDKVTIQVLTVRSDL